MMQESNTDVTDLIFRGGAPEPSCPTMKVDENSAKTDKDTTTAAPKKSTDNRYTCPHHAKGKRMKTREKIEKLVNEGTKNYPAYLKLIYTGDSDFSSDFSSDEEGVHYERGHRKSGEKKDTILDKQQDRVSSPKLDSVKKNEKHQKNLSHSQSSSGVVQNGGVKAKTPEEKSAIEERIPERHNKKDSPDGPNIMKACISAQKDDSFYDTIDRTAEYDNEINNSSMTEEERAREQEQMRQELAKLEEEITTLRSVLSTKQREAANIKHKLGITPMTEMKQDLRVGLTNIKESDTYRKTSEQLSKLNTTVTTSAPVVKTTAALHQIEDAVVNSPPVKKTGEAIVKLEESITNTEAYQKTNQAFKTFGQWSSKKLGDVRNSNSFKSFEEKMGGAYTSVRSLVSPPPAKAETDETKMTGSRSEDNFDEALRAHQENGNAASSPASIPEDPPRPL